MPKTVPVEVLAELVEDKPVPQLALDQQCGDHYIKFLPN